MMRPSALREILAYDPATGEIRWKQPPHPKIKVGQLAGTKGPQHRAIMIGGKWHQAHRLAWMLHTGAAIPPDMVIDHKNCDGHDNRWNNLRLATISQNGANSRPRKRSLPKGVSTHVKAGRTVGFRAFISAGNGKARYLGLFSTPAAAHAAYRRAAEEAYGEFARFTA